jgi:putative acetyltransferase
MAPGGPGRKRAAGPIGPAPGLYGARGAGYRRRDVLIRPFEDADLDPLMAVWRRASALAHPWLAPAELDRDEALIRNQYLRRTETWCALDDGRLLGFLSLVGTRIVALFVDPSDHRRGIGQRLLAHANQRHGPLAVEVFADNRIALPFYRRHGFRLAREEPNPLYPDQTQWLMAQPGADLEAGGAAREE